MTEDLYTTLQALSHHHLSSCIEQRSNKPLQRHDSVYVETTLWAATSMNKIKPTPYIIIIHLWEKKMNTPELLQCNADI